MDCRCRRAFQVPHRFDRGCFPQPLNEMSNTVDFCKTAHDSPSLPLLRTQYGHALDIPSEASERPFVRHLVESPQQKLTEAHHQLDDAEHQLDRLLAQGVMRASSRGLELVFHR